MCGPCHEDVAEAASRLAARGRLADAGRAHLGRPVRRPRPLARDRPLRRAASHRDASPRANSPGLVLRVGDMPTSKPLRAFVAESSQIVVDPHGAWHEPTRTAELVLQAAAERRPSMPSRPRSRCARERATTGWVEGVEGCGREGLGRGRGGARTTSRARSLRGVEPELPDDAVVWVSSSMPIRDVEAFFPQSPKRVRFLANRGANGIDGVVSSAMGAAIATGLPTWVLIGELALQHDAGGLLAARRAGVPLEIVCIDNGGGGIFDFLPVAEHADPAAYEAHIATPSEDAGLAALWPGLREVRTDRRQNVRLHRELVERVAGAPLARRRSRPGRSCGGSARRPCRRPSRRAGSMITTAASAIAAPAVSEPSSIGMRGRFSCLEHVVLGPEDHARDGEDDGHDEADRPGAEALAPAVEARHPAAHVAAAVVGDREHRDQQDAADDPDRVRVRVRVGLADLAEAEDRARPRSGSRAGSRPCRSPRASRRRPRPS